MEVGDLVRVFPYVSEDEYSFGVVLEISVNMWGEETKPSGVRIFRDSDIGEEVYPEDELEVINVT